MAVISYKTCFVFLWFTALGTSVVGIEIGEPHRAVLCREGRFDFKNLQCKPQNSERTLIGLHKVMFGYQNDSVNCTETEDTMGCEEQMSDRQMIIMLGKGSAQQSITALQFPAVDSPKYCNGYGDQPVYMAFIFDCLKETNIKEMCGSFTQTGQRLSVYNPGYPAIASVQSTHHCECSVTSPSPVIIVTIYDFRLNCTGNNQNLTIEDEHGVVLNSVCDSFQNGQRNSSNQNLTMVWKGQRNYVGLFWIGFHAADDVSNVTVDCYPVWDPTTTTTTTTTTTVSTTSTTINTVGVSSFVPITGQAVPGSPASNQSETTTTQSTKVAEHQKTPMPKTVIYALAGAGGGLFLILIIVCVVVVKRRNNVEETDTMQMRNVNTGTDKEQKQNKHSGEFKGKLAENRIHSTGTEVKNKDDSNKRRASSNSVDTFEGIKGTSEQIQEQSKRVPKSTASVDKVNAVTDGRRESASSGSSKGNNKPRKTSPRKASETTYDIKRQTNERNSRNHPPAKPRQSRSKSNSSQSRGLKTSPDGIDK